MLKLLTQQSVQSRCVCYSLCSSNSWGVELLHNVTMFEGKNKVELWAEQYVVGGFKMHKRAVRVSSVHGPPSTLLPHPRTKPSLCPLASVCGPEVGKNKSAETRGAGLLSLTEG